MSNDIIMATAKKVISTPKSVSRSLAYVEELCAGGAAHVIQELAQSKKAGDRKLSSEIARATALHAAIESARKGNWNLMAAAIKARLGSDGVKYDPVRHKNTDTRHQWRFIPKFNAVGVNRFCAAIYAAQKRDERDSDSGYQARIKTLNIFADILEAVEYLRGWEQSQPQITERIEV